MGDTVSAVMADWRSAPIRPELRAALEFLTKFVPPEQDFDAHDIQKMRDAGLSDDAIKDVMYASFSFQNISRIADALNFPLLTDKQRKGAAFMLRRSNYLNEPVGPDF